MIVTVKKTTSYEVEIPEFIYKPNSDEFIHVMPAGRAQVLQRFTYSDGNEEWINYHSLKFTPDEDIVFQEISRDEFAKAYQSYIRHEMEQAENFGYRFGLNGDDLNGLAPIEELDAAADQMEAESGSEDARIEGLADIALAEDPDLE